MASTTRVFIYVLVSILSAFWLNACAVAIVTSRYGQRWVFSLEVFTSLWVPDRRRGPTNKGMKETKAEDNGPVLDRQWRGRR
jgi:hypothetical protein